MHIYTTLNAQADFVGVRSVRACVLMFGSLDSVEKGSLAITKICILKPLIAATLGYANIKTNANVYSYNQKSTAWYRGTRRHSYSNILHFYRSSLELSGIIYGPYRRKVVLLNKGQADVLPRPI